MAAPTKVEELTALLDATIDELDRVNLEGETSSLETRALMCGLQCKIWSINTSLALRVPDMKAAERYQKLHKEWEAESHKAEKARHMKLFPKILEILAERERAGERLQELTADDVPDFDIDDE